MWTVIKYKLKSLPLLKNDISNKLGTEPKFYIPKIKLEKYKKNNISYIENLLLGDYVLCFHEKFSNKNTINSLKFCKGLKYFLNDFFNSQDEIENFIEKCKKHEDKDGYIKQSFFNFNNKKNFEFITGPFTSMIFKIIEENKTNFKVLIGNHKATVSKEDYLFRPV